MTAAVIEAESVPRVESEVSKTKLNFNLSPAAGINLVLAPVRVHRHLSLDSVKSPPNTFFGRVWLHFYKTLSGWSVRVD